LVENTLYRIHKSYLTLKSEFFAEMFLPPSEPDDADECEEEQGDTPKEGESDDYPIRILLEVTKDWDVLMCWYYRPSHQAYNTLLLDEAFLLPLLVMANKYIIPDAILEAKACLLALPSFGPPSMLCVGRICDQLDWIRLATTALSTDNIQKLGYDDIRSIGLATYKLLVDAKAAIDLHRRYLAYAVPDVIHHAACKFGVSRCARGFSVGVWTAVARSLLHPESPMTLKEALENLENVEASKMDVRCLDLTVAQLQRGSAFVKEDVLRQSCVEEMRRV